MANSLIETKKKVPRDAFQFAVAGKLTFAAPDGKSGANVPVTMLARSKEPVNSYWWGRCVHDFSGMKLRKETCPIDYCHDYDEIVGYLNDFQVTTEGLMVSGLMVPFQADDRATEVAFKGAAGVPYEASIDFCGPGLRVEEIGEGVTVQVNGQPFTGPGVVFREWPLRAVAICPYGADSKSRTEFADESADQVEVTIVSQERVSQMSDSKSPATPTTATQQTETAAPAAAPPVNVPDPRAALTAELNKFTAKFGAENGAKWFGEGKSFADALELHCVALVAQLTAKDLKIKELNDKLGAVQLGEASPVSASDADKGKQPGGTAEKFSSLGGNHAKIAGGIKLPTK